MPEWRSHSDMPCPSFLGGLILTLLGSKQNHGCLTASRMDIQTAQQLSTCSGQTLLESTGGGEVSQTLPLELTAHETQHDAIPCDSVRRIKQRDVMEGFYGGLR